ncbi:MAG: hypothetical protein L6R28_07580 [Planctomycetes bacterium]|nr:hypothetical protein [Planctomycetota bacterium]
MTDRDRILAMLRGKRPDRVPWFGDLAYWAVALRAQGKLPPKSAGISPYLEWHRGLRVGYYLQGYNPFNAVYDDTVRKHTRTIDRITQTTYETPVGAIEDAWTYQPASLSSAPTRHLIRTVDDLRVYRYILEHSHFEADYGNATERKTQMGGAGIVLCYLPKSPFMELVARLSGIEAVVELVDDAQDELDHTLEIMESKWDAAAELAVASPAECLMIPENLSSDVVGPRFFERYLRPYQEKWTKRIRDAGKFSFIHMDGRLRGLLRQEGSVGFTVLEALTPHPCGDVFIHQMRELAGPTSILWGGIPGSYFTPLVSNSEFERHVVETLDFMRQDGRSVLGVADQVPPDGLETRVRRVAELADRHGRY